MSGSDRKGFDWKEIADVLHIAGVSSQVTFWQEVQCLRAKNVDLAPLAIDHDKASDSNGGKRDKPGKEAR
jgi:hypothetical protein